MLVVDHFERPLASLRISVTDRCNLRCRYCMPEESYEWLPRADLLTFEETARLAGIFGSLGVDKVRLTGGEPLLRADVTTLVGMLARDTRFDDLALTTNGVLLADHAAALRTAGLRRVTISLDTVRRERFQAMTRRDLHTRVLQGIQAAADAGFTGTKIDSVIMRGWNDDELVDLLEFGKQVGAEVRFIEYMDVGGATHWSLAQVVSRDEMLARIGDHYGAIEPVAEHSSAPATRFRLPDGTVFGIIASTTAPFCRTCDRSRLTADGLWYLCLYAPRGVDLRGPLRDGASDEEIAHIITSIWSARRDRGAEIRAALPDREVLVGIERLRRDPHLEMHTRGG
jgi:cyclic pyranopterin phosphate synthase